MMSKGLVIAGLLLFALVLSGCSLGPLFGRAEAPLIVVSPAPENPAATAAPPPTPTPESLLPNDVSGTLEEGTPAAGPSASNLPPAEIATSTGLLKVPTPIPTPERPRLEIKSSSIRLSEDGQKYLIEGQLYNGGNSSADLTNFKLVAYLYDRHGSLLTRAMARPTLTRLSPQASTSFRITADYILGVDTYKLQGGY